MRYILVRTSLEFERIQPDKRRDKMIYIQLWVYVGIFFFLTIVSCIQNSEVYAKVYGSTERTWICQNCHRNVWFAKPKFSGNYECPNCGKCK